MAAAAHQSSFAQMVPAPPAHANRFEEAADEVINPMVLGALTPRIADLNVEYFGFMWPNNAAAGVRYGAALDGLGSALMMPSMPAISGGSVAAVAVAAASCRGVCGAEWDAGRGGDGRFGGQRGGRAGGGVAGGGDERGVLVGVLGVDAPATRRRCSRWRR